MKDSDTKALIIEIQSVKKLLMLHLLKIGYKQTHLAAALGVSEATVSRMLPKGLPKGVTTTESSST